MPAARDDHPGVDHARKDRRRRVGRDRYPLMRQLQLPHFVHPGQAVFAVQVVEKCPHDKSPSL